MPLSSTGKKILKITWIAFGSLILLLTALHIWVVYHAEEIIQELVASKSKGKLNLEVRNLKFKWFSNKMELQDAVFYTTDSVNASTTYRFAVRKINLKIRAVWPLIFDKKVLINQLEVKDPFITVTILRQSRDEPRKNVSVPQEMGKIYRSIQDALEVLQVKKFELDNASFTLINKLQPDQQPFSIGHIDLTIHDLRVDTSRLTGRERILFSENIVLKSRDQDIIFPNGRHRLAFQKFRINIEKKIVEFDSCTIAAVKTGNTPTGFSIFFDKLVMTDIDFDTLYRSEVIKADSVYCISPTFNFISDLDMRKKLKKKLPGLDDVIRRLTGDLMVNYVVVNDASFNINTIRNGTPSSFRSQRNNFEMQGLRIDNNAKKPFRVERFSMAIRDYENFLRDSLYALRFDSIHLNNDRIFLNNFSFQRLHKGKPINSFSVPRFQLTGLSWDDLLFERKLTAHGATLYDPVIHYNELPGKNPAKKKRSIFEILDNVNDVLMLEDMKIVDGDIRINLDGGTSLHLDKATLSVESRQLLGSNQYAAIRRSINYFDFSRGILKINDLTIQLDSINYTGSKSMLRAKAAYISNANKTIDAVAKDVAMNEIFINEITGDVSIGGIQWQQANIHYHKRDTANGSGGVASFISLTDIKGRNTRFNSTIGNKNISAWFDHISATALLLKTGEIPIAADLEVAGNNLTVSDSSTNLAIKNFGIYDQRAATLEEFTYQKTGENDSTSLEIDKVSFVPDIQSAIEREVRATNLHLTRPRLFIHSTQKESVGAPFWFLPTGYVDKVTIEKPLVNISKQTPNGTWKWHWDGTKDGQPSLVLSNFFSDSVSLSIGKLDMSLNNWKFEPAIGRPFNSDSAEISAHLKDISYQRQPIIDWQGTIVRMTGKKFVFDSLGKKKGRLDLQSWQLEDMMINKTSTKSLRNLSAINDKFKIENVSATYNNREYLFEWDNVQYNKEKKLFSLDSFFYTPVINQEEFSKKLKYQADFIRLKTGKTIISNFDPGGWFEDSAWKADKVVVQNVLFNDFRDKTLPLRMDVVKPILTNLIKTIPVKIAVDSLLLENAHVNYAELNPKTGKTGTIPVHRMELIASPVRNFNLSPTDSLHLYAEGYLMDTARVRLNLHMSYGDSLAGFLLTARIDPMNVTVLNPVLIPLSSAKIRSGNLDSLLMRVNADEYYGFGEIDMHYDNLKIQILQSADQKSRKFKMALVNMLANSFVIKNKNTKRTGIVFFVRHRERSTINYIVKMLMSGVTSSVGAKTTQKNFKPYKKQLRQRNLPPADYD